MTSPPPVLSWAAGPTALIYENALIGLADVLREADQGHWARWVADDLRAWRARGDTSHHRSAYGGMGSLNDVAIWGQPWLGGAFEQLRHLAASSADTAARDPSRFVQYPGVGPLRISFFRCRACDSCFAAGSEIDWAAATGWASHVVPRLVSAGDGSAVLPSVKGELSPDERHVYRDFIAARLPEIGLQEYEVGRYWESACPACSKIEWYRESLPIF